MSLHITCNMNPTKLADKMIEMIKKSWADPFNPPTVIFPDSSTEQWFKLYWINNKNSTLLNLGFDKLDNYLFKKVSCGENYKNLSADLLKLVIVKKLVENDYYTKLGSDVAEYLTDEGEINSNRLYDYASIMADLFLEYERTRPEWKASGNDSPWQESEVRLYNDLFADGYVELNGERYSTIAQLNINNSRHCDCSENSPLFLFGFSGLGDTYIEILCSLADTMDIHVYLLADKNDSWEFFSSHGKTALKQWKDYKVENLDGSRPVNGDFVPIFLAASSKVREIERLHYEICNMLENEGISPRLSEIKVFAPDIREYIPAISLVFNQKVRQKNGSRRIIPYSISGFSAKTSNVYEAVKILFDVFEKGYFSRMDFNKLIRNPVVMATRGITEDDVDNWKKWIEELNVFRKNDWETARNRFLLAKLTNDSLDGISPYEPLVGDDSSLVRFINMVDDLSGWISQKAECKDFKLDEGVRQFLRGMLSMSGVHDKSLEGEREVYRNVMGAVKNLEKVFGEKADCRITFLTLLDSIRGVSLSMAGAAKGIEFMSVKPGRVIPAKYSFFIGMDSNSFPGTDTRSVLDVRTLTEDEKNPVRNKYALYCQMKATENRVYFSYVNKNLKKDESFYRSSVLNEIAKKLNRFEESEIEDSIGIDTFRWAKCFTDRNKRDNDLPREQKTDDSHFKPQEPPRRVTVSQLRRFLEEPLKFQIETAFGSGDDDIETEEIEFEPVYLDNLTASDLRKKYIKEDTDDSVIEAELIDIIGDNVFERKASQELKQQIDTVRNSIADNIGKLQDIIFEKDSEVVVGDSFSIAGPFAPHLVDSDNKRLSVLDLKKYNKSKDYLNAYVTSLALMSEIDTSESFEIVLYIINPENGKCSDKRFSCSSGEAKVLLEKIYQSAFSQKFSECIPVDKMEDFLDEEKEFESRKEAVKKMSDGNGLIEPDDLQKVFTQSKDKTILKRITEILKISEVKDSIGNTTITFDNLFIQSKKETGYKQKDPRKFIDLYADAYDKSRYCFDSMQIAKVEELKIDPSKKKELFRKLDAIFAIMSENKSCEISVRELFLKVFPSDARIRELIGLFDSMKDGKVYVNNVISLLEKDYSRSNNIDIDGLIESLDGENGPWGFFRKSRIVDLPDGLGYGSDEKEFLSQWRNNVSLQKELLIKLIKVEAN